MVCDDNGTFLDIQIPSVMLPQSAGDTLEAGLLRDESGVLCISLSYLHWLDPLFTSVIALTCRFFTSGFDVKATKKRSPLEYARFTMAIERTFLTLPCGFLVNS